MSLTSPIIIAKTLELPNNHELVARADSPPGEAGSFPSLSKGTLNNTPKLINPLTTKTQIFSLNKVYPNKIMFFRFKHTRKTSELSPETPSNEIARTLDQIEDSIKRSLARTKREISDIVDCNDFDKFATFTFDPKKHPQCNDYDFAKAKMVNWLNNTQRKHGSFRYLLVPERQSNGNLHFHALLGGFTGKFYPTNIRGNGNNARQCYKLNSWEKYNGFADMEDIGNKEATGKYIAKYISKDLSFILTGNGLEPVYDNFTGVIGKHTSIVAKNGKRYYSSKGLKKPKKQYNLELENVISQTKLNLSTVEIYENDFIEVTTIHKK